MSEYYVDVNARVVWSRYKLHRARLIMAMLGTLAGAVIGTLGKSNFDLVLGWGTLAISFPWAFYEIYCLMKPNSALIELLPQGIIFRNTTEHFIVPWTEIEAIDTIDVHTSLRGRKIVFGGVTVVVVSRNFYERVIHIDSFVMRGPGWDGNFIPKGDKQMQLALHHELLPASAEEVRRQVEARWEAFGRSLR
ncbi:MAG: hypothetical protein KF904_17800 [Rhodoblastus sp.]|nr:hypothetical protein [Rhodoblastus sp.]